MTLLAKRQERSIVPRMYYITTAIDYTNGPPHIGHAYEKVLADVLARWHRMKGEEVYFLTGAGACQQYHGAIPGAVGPPGNQQ